MAVSIILHAGAVVAAVAVSYARAHMPRHEEAVAVTFRPPSPPPPPPPPPAGHKPKTPRPKPVVKVTPPAAIIQPKETPKEEKLPEPEEEEEEEGTEGGVEGGVVGGVVGGVPGGTGTVVAPRLEADESTVHLKKISGPIPEYTEQAMEHEVQGVMIVKCVVTTDGTVYGCRVLKSLPFMDRQVISALERSRYEPYLVNGRPVEIDMTFRIRLQLPQ